MDLRVNRTSIILHRTAPVETVYIIVEGRFLQVGKVSHTGVGRVVLGTGRDAVRCDVDADRLAAVDVGRGGVAGRCGRTWSAAVDGGRTVFGCGAEHRDVAARVLKVNSGIKLTDGMMTGQLGNDWVLGY